MLKIKLQLLILLIPAVAFGQSVAGRSPEPAKPKIFYSVGAALGNAASPTSWIGLQISVMTKYLEGNIGAGYSNLQKAFIGLGLHSKLDKKFVAGVSAEYGFTFEKRFAFNKGGSDERRYVVKPSQLLNYGICLVWNPDFMTNENYSVSGFFIKLGLRQPIAYSIVPDDPAKMDASEINRIYKENFGTGIYFNVGIRVVAMHD